MDFGRIDVRDPDLCTLQPNCIAVDHAGVTAKTALAQIGSLAVVGLTA